MASLQDLRSAALRLIGNMTSGAPATFAATGTAAATVKTTGAITYTSNGKLKSKAALSGQALTAAPTTSSTKADGTAFTATEVTNWTQYVIPANKTVYIVMALDGGGNVIVLQGEYDSQDLAFRGKMMAKGVSQIPEIPDGVTPFGLIKCAASVAITLGTTASDTSGLTYYDIGVLPATTTL